MDQFRKSIPFAKMFTKAAIYQAAPGQKLGDYCFKKLDKIRKLNVNIPASRYGNCGRGR